MGPLYCSSYRQAYIYIYHQKSLTLFFSDLQTYTESIFRMFQFIYFSRSLYACSTIPNTIKLVKENKDTSIVSFTEYQFSTYTHYSQSFSRVTSPIISQPKYYNTGLQAYSVYIQHADQSELGLFPYHPSCQDHRVTAMLQQADNTPAIIEVYFAIPT